MGKERLQGFGGRIKEVVTLLKSERGFVTVNMVVPERLEAALLHARKLAAERAAQAGSEVHHWINQATLNGKDPHS
jgi:hypothetical protein